MGTTVLKTSTEAETNFPLYAHCSSGRPGAVTLLAINNDRDTPRTLDFSGTSERYTLTASKLEGTKIQLNGKELSLGSNDSMPELAGVPTQSGPVTLPAASITFLEFGHADNKSCQ
jgi:hypothetical protein